MVPLAMAFSIAVCTSPPASCPDLTGTWEASQSCQGVENPIRVTQFGCSKVDFGHGRLFELSKIVQTPTGTRVVQWSKDGTELQIVSAELVGQVVYSSSAAQVSFKLISGSTTDSDQMVVTGIWVTPPAPAENHSCAYSRAQQ